MTAIARIAGALTTTPDRAPPLPAAGEERTRITLEGAFVIHDSSLVVAREGNSVGISLGTPRFTNSADAALAREQSTAAAWLAAFRRDGLDAPAGIRGRFAVVVLDVKGRSLRLAVDRFGTWPLCYRLDDGRIAFSDRADEVPACERRISSQAIFEYLYFHVIPAPRTVFDAVERLPAGSVLAWDRGTLTRHRYWTARFIETRAADLASLKHEFRAILRAAVAREADGHVAGAFLSGGTDSSTVAGMLGQVTGERARTYSIGFDAGGYDEMAYARIAAKHFATDHHEYYVTPTDLIEGIPRVATHYDQPFGNSSVLPAWVCARIGRDDGVGRMLAGDGGDELFGGNVRYAKQRVFGWYDKVPHAIRRHLVEPMLGVPAIATLPIARKGASYVRQARVPMPDRAEASNLLLHLGAREVLTPAFLSRIDQDIPLAMQRETWQAVQADTLVNRMLAYDWKYTLEDSDLPKVVGATAMAGVDVAFPLLDDELVDFSLRLPPEWKIKGLTLRWFFKEALRGFLPDAILAKKKHGFGLPFGVWAVEHKGLGRVASGALAAFASRGVIQPGFLKELGERRLPQYPRYYGEMVWIVMVLELWIQAHAPEWRCDG
jgi:asparagine synthase (glutamine-hydrolysing)